MVDIIIDVSELRDRGDGRFQVSLRFNREREFTVEIRDPARAGTEDLLSWYFEKSLASAPGRNERRQEAVDELRKYGVELFQQLFGRTDVGLELEQYRRRAFADCRLLITGNLKFHRLHWEALRHPDFGEPLSVMIPVQRRARDPRIMWTTDGARASLNVLVVPARPYGADDLNYRTVTRVLLAESWNSDQPFRVDLVRPGTWRALEQHLHNVNEDPRRGPGWYQAIHFDAHGIVSTPRRLQELPGSAEPLPPHKGLDDEDAYLLFETDTDGTAGPVPADAVAELLARHRIPVAVLNSCQSAKGPSNDSSLAERLCAAGVPVAVGMAYAVTPLAAEQAMPVFYRAMAGGKNPAQAVKEARRELLFNPMRVDQLNRRVRLEDWLVPVIFQQAETVRLEFPTMTKQELEEHYAERADAGPEPHAITGRDSDVFAVERMLLRPGAPNEILIHGAAGAGKTAFTTELLRWWWLRTGLAKQAVTIPLDDPALSTRAIVRDIASALFSGSEFQSFHESSWNVQMERVANHLRAHQYLLILDSGDNGLPDRAELHRFLKHLLGGKSWVVVTSRAEEPELARATFGSSRYLLHPFADRLRPVADHPAPAESGSATVTVHGPEEREPGSIGTVPPEVTRHERELDYPQTSQPTATRLRRDVRRGTITASALLACTLIITAVVWANGRTTDPYQAGPATPTNNPATTTAAVKPAPEATEPPWLNDPVATGVVITSPTEGARVDGCILLQGTVEGLAPGQTLMAAIRQVRKDGTPFFYYLVDDPETQASRRAWSAKVAGGGARDQEHDIYVLVGEVEAIREAQSTAEGNFDSQIPINDLRRAAQVRVDQKRVSAC
ncbi:CHAT domain-containing protein [Actinoplanes sp. CA-015351]|uniref:CHAT domain-containing protein n=1 Tax=Actinoplanes sp. CA-015351 TaxID=3239897 RepID=UPI003D96DAA9